MGLEDVRNSEMTVTVDIIAPVCSSTHAPVMHGDCTLCMGTVNHDIMGKNDDQ